MSTLTQKQIANRRKWADALQSSKKTKFRLYRDAGGVMEACPTPGMCCLGVACEVVLGMDKATLRHWYAPVDSWGLPDAVGFAPGEEIAFVTANDSDDMPHPDIGLYLYLTAEAGIAGA